MKKTVLLKSLAMVLSLSTFLPFFGSVVFAGRKKPACTVTKLKKLTDEGMQRIRVDILNLFNELEYLKDPDPEKIKVFLEKIKNDNIVFNYKRSAFNPDDPSYFEGFCRIMVYMFYLDYLQKYYDMTDVMILNKGTTRVFLTDYGLNDEVIFHLKKGDWHLEICSNLKDVWGTFVDSYNFLKVFFENSSNIVDESKAVKLLNDIRMKFRDMFDLSNPLRESLLRENQTRKYKGSKSFEFERGLFELFEQNNYKSLFQGFFEIIDCYFGTHCPEYYWHLLHLVRPIVNEENQARKIQQNNEFVQQRISMLLPKVKAAEIKNKEEEEIRKEEKEKSRSTKPNPPTGIICANYSGEGIVPKDEKEIKSERSKKAVDRIVAAEIDQKQIIEKEKEKEEENQKRQAEINSQHERQRLPDSLLSDEQIDDIFNNIHADCSKGAYTKIFIAKENGAINSVYFPFYLFQRINKKYKKKSQRDKFIKDLKRTIYDISRMTENFFYSELQIPAIDKKSSGYKNFKLNNYTENVQRLVGLSKNPVIYKFTPAGSLKYKDRIAFVKNGNNILVFDFLGHIDGGEK